MYSRRIEFWLDAAISSSRIAYMFSLSVKTVLLCIKRLLNSSYS